MSVHDVSNYKYAKVFLNDLSKVILSLERVEKEISPFIRYKAIIEVLNAPYGIREALVVLKLARDQCKDIISSKGELK